MWLSSRGGVLVKCVRRVERKVLDLEGRGSSQGLVEAVETRKTTAKRQEMRNSRMTVEVKIVHRKMKGTSNVLAVHMPTEM